MRAGNTSNKPRQPQISKMGPEKFRSELRNGLFRGTRNTLGMSTFFRGITESIPSLFRGIFSERNSVANPSSRTGPIGNISWRAGTTRGWPIEIDTLEYQQTEKIETEMKDVGRIRIRKVYASCPGLRHY